MASRMATKSQLSFLFTLYSKGIGEYRARWYISQLKEREITMEEASKEIARLCETRTTAGPTAMKPEEWEKIQPSEEELEAFWDDFSKKIRRVEERL